VNQFPPDCLVEALSQHSSNPSNRGRGETFVRLEREELVDVSDSQFDELLPPEDRQDMKANNRLIVAEGAGCDLVAHDIVEPSLEEFRHVDVTRLEKLTVVDPPSQLLFFDDTYVRSGLPEES
jgi:hypothetical protein